MSDIVVSVDDLSKSYLIGHQSAQRERYVALRDVLGREARNYIRKAADLLHGKQIIQGDEIEELWALKNVSFEIRQGEVVGIIGRNGAGKSTLLKILSRITKPTRGRVRLRGRVGSLLEVGTGFHPELTGRENIFLNGAILGMKRSDIRRRFDEIVAFADVEKFLDTPVKRYSSGMYVRLAFAVAAHLDPEILIVDEVLAVGDAAFQKKCLGSMTKVAQSGRIVLFVSHNLGAIRTLTRRCIHLDNGSIVSSGTSTEVVENYLKSALASKASAPVGLDHYREISKVDFDVKIKSIRVLTADYDEALVPRIALNSKITFEIGLEVCRPIRDMHTSIFLKNSKGDTVLLMVSLDNNRVFSFEPGFHKIFAHIEELPLSPECYFAEIGVGKISQPSYDIIQDLPLFEVVNNAQVVHWSERPWGVLHCRSVNWEAA